ncbi:hypothetical protein E2C01_011393 [Portunus trituberculatus]|uniref:Uncharacterized protein n=1 Tax=Portunus trituberculatus TaxID=210409 RepID=A0A5B7DB66_PORTR|nr:hypothetical protein [Portunus trituberculatus]
MSSSSANAEAVVALFLAYRKPGRVNRRKCLWIRSWLNAPNGVYQMSCFVLVLKVRVRPVLRANMAGSLAKKPHISNNKSQKMPHPAPTGNLSQISSKSSTAVPQSCGNSGG